MNHLGLIGKLCGNEIRLCVEWNPHNHDPWNLVNFYGFTIQGVWFGRYTRRSILMREDGEIIITTFLLEDVERHLTMYDIKYRVEYRQGYRMWWVPSTKFNNVRTIKEYLEISRA